MKPPRPHLRQFLSNLEELCLGRNKISDILSIYRYVYESIYLYMHISISISICIMNISSDFF